MFDAPTLDKYDFYFSKDKQKVIAVSTYAGRPVRGVAICSPEDTYDVWSGKVLAAARCNQKVAEKRLKRAEKKLREATAAFTQAQKHMLEMNDYYEDARRSNFDAKKQVNNILNEM